MTSTTPHGALSSSTTTTTTTFDDSSQKHLDLEKHAHMHSGAGAVATTDNTADTTTISSSALPPHGLTRPKLILLFLGMALCVFLACLDVSIIATALPRITSDFNAQTQMSWVATSYLIAYNSFNPLYGRFSDIFGRKMMILVALTIFLLGSLGCAASSSILMLILFRAIQGFGAAGLSSVCLITVGDMFSDVAERARYQSVFWATFAISSIIGPLLGGVLVEHATWRWCFWINLPLGALAVTAIVIFHQIPFKKTVLKEQLKRIDFLGVLFIIATVTCLLLRDIAVLYTLNCLAGMVFMGCTFYVPLYFQVVKGASTTLSGVLLMPMIIGFCISCISSSVVLKWIKDYRLHLWTGLAVMTIGVGLMIRFQADTTTGELIAYGLITGFGNGLILQNCMLAAQEAASKEDIAIATALCQFANSVGNALGVAICASALNNALVRNLAKLPEAIQGIIADYDVVNDVTAIPLLSDNIKVEAIQAYAEAFQFLFMILTALSATAFLCSLFLRKAK
ncbi:hypothetical protein BGZ94_001880 [Podila epigama]|nr:hypothetical protein BGZ94_001880 [Podila epigama]